MNIRVIAFSKLLQINRKLPRTCRISRHIGETTQLQLRHKLRRIRYIDFGDCCRMYNDLCPF